MEKSIYFMLSFLVIAFTLASATSDSLSVSFLQCLSSNLHHPKPLSKVILDKNSSAYLSVLQSSIRNLRFLNISKTEPEFIITPFHEGHIQASVICARNCGMQMRIRSGGHDYEGLSYASYEQFLLVDLTNLRSVAVDIENETAWVESGATLGELYYEIAKKSNVLGFPAGSCPTVGVGGHISGGGFGTIFRKFGLAADQVIDAKIVDANGKILDRKSMGEDLFWAIRGGGGASFGVIFSWKLKLVSVPPTVTVFSVGKTIEQGANKLLQNWQNIGHELPEDLFLHAALQADDSSSNDTRTIRVAFHALFLGGAEKLLTLMHESFPELSIRRENCSEMSWIQSVLYFAGFSTGESSNVLLNRTTEYSSSFFKAKSDYVRNPVPEQAWNGLYKMLIEEETSYLILTPYGGRMSKISDLETPFPHRKGNMYKIQYMVTWNTEEETHKFLEWMRSVYAYMTPYVSKSPRAAYFNYRDLDLGSNNIGRNTSIVQASLWGQKYFKRNFKRLVRVKSEVDPSNFFRNEQSIPVLS